MSVKSPGRAGPRYFAWGALQAYYVAFADFGEAFGAVGVGMAVRIHSSSWGLAVSTGFCSFWVGGR